MVSQGVIDVAYESTINSSPVIVEHNIFSLPFFINNFENLDKLEYGETGKAIFKVMEEKVFVNEFGVVDEGFITPVIEEIIANHFPVSLLSPFRINFPRIKQLDSEIRRGKIRVVSRTSLNALKRLTVVKYTTEGKSLSMQEQLKQFETFSNQNQYSEMIPILYNEALDILQNVLKIGLNEIYEALWNGSSKILNLIIPVDYIQQE